MTRRKRRRHPSDAVEQLNPRPPAEGNPGLAAVPDGTRPKRLPVAELSLAELSLELSALTSTDRRLFASEERRRTLLVAEMGRRDDERAAVVAADTAARAFADVRAAQARLALLEEPGSTQLRKV